MALEIERKYLVIGQAWREEVVRTVEMRQGYLVTGGGRASVRVRMEGDNARLNIKASTLGPERAEYEYAIPVADCREMLENLSLGRVEKIRHYIERDGLTWEVDEFLNDNAGLVIAEVELESADQAFAKPAWLGRDLTYEPRYYNHALALRPWGIWPEKERG